MLSLHFLGAAKTVTGSKYVLNIGGKRVMVDCGLFQGLKELRQRNWDEFPVDPGEIDLLVLTHAHIDHSGYIPKLVKSGFKGPILCSPPTADLLKVMLPDSAHLQEEESRYANKEGYSKHTPALPLYTVEDAVAALEQVRTFPEGEIFKITNKAQFRYLKAGHILGAMMIEFEIKQGQSKRKIVFSGDLGRKDFPLLPDPDHIKNPDYLILESTYGDRLHPEQPELDIFKKAIREVAEKESCLLIPAFAVERTQEILYFLKMLTRIGEIPALPVFLDSPMATQVTHIFEEYMEILDPDVKELLVGKKLFEGPNFHFAGSVDESKNLNDIKGPLIIIAGNGMATGGRVTHHLKHRLPNPDNIVLLVGYQAVGTRGRLLLEGAQLLKLHGEYIPVNAKVMNMEGLSAHADYLEILDWLSTVKQAPLETYITHGEPASAQSLAEKIKEQYDFPTYVPDYLELVEL